MKSKTLTLSKGQSDFFNEKSRFKCLNSGRRFGKTVVLVASACQQIFKYPNSIVVMTEPIRLQIKRTLMPELIKWIPPSQILNINMTDYIFEFVNGSILYLGSTHNYDTFRGTGIDLLLMDETADNEPASFFEVFRPALSDRQGRGIFAGTPKGKSNWWYDLTNQFQSYHYKTIEGGRVTAEEIEMAKTELDERTFRQEYEASFETTSSTVYYTFTAVNNTVDEVKFRSDATTFICWDFNIGENPLACLVVQKYDDEYYIIDDLSFQYSNTEMTATYVVDYLDKKQFAGQLFVTGDYAGRSYSSKASTNDYDIIMFKLKKYNPELVIKPTRSIKNRVSCMNSMFRSMTGKTKLWIGKNCKKLIDDLMRLEWHQSGAGFMKKKGIDHSHRPDAISYLAYNFENVVEREELESIG